MEPYKSYGRNSYHRHPNNNMNCNCSTGRNNSEMSQMHNHPAGCHSMPNPNCKDENTHMRHMSLAMAYVPMQEWGELYSPDEAICQGTAFPVLNLIFCGKRGKM